MMSEPDDEHQVVNFEAERIRRLPELQARRARRRQQELLAALWRVREATGLYPPHWCRHVPDDGPDAA